ncbi:DUF1643 domain-containing protein [Phycicoccus sp.]|uniref:DUF1643 domain-containing protein n=1 Tax=Phycicoccus sp. TaxID=1902410 RepID=UPI002D0AC9AB|nr:DUF1643 domain-containing protein [Phycicoccus sp.]HMM95318.1 DUF1643 domain-containing protein [Phycicoccus sp.]
MSDLLPIEVPDRGDGIERGAVFGDEGNPPLHRYRLTRRWGPGAPVVFVMLNPSIADHRQDDPTIRRCIGYARGWGFSAMHVVNLYAYRATKPPSMWAAETLGYDIVGPGNDDAIRDEVEHAGLVVAAWGVHARLDRVRRFFELADGDVVTALSVTAVGAPGHPLYLRADLQPEPYRPKGIFQ